MSKKKDKKEAKYYVKCTECGNIQEDIFEFIECQSCGCWTLDLNNPIYKKEKD